VSLLSLLNDGGNDSDSHEYDDDRKGGRADVAAPNLIADASLAHNR
jgi:hypothetical protein